MALIAHPQWHRLQLLQQPGKGATHGQRADGRLPMLRSSGGASYAVPLQDTGYWANGFEEVPRSHTPDDYLPKVTAASFLEASVPETQKPQRIGVCKCTYPLPFGKEAPSSCLFCFYSSQHARRDP